MDDSMFKKALSDVVTSGCNVYTEHEDHIFSDRFEQNMQKLISRRRKPYYYMINTVGKRIACVITILFVGTFATAMSVEAFRNVIAGFFVDIFERFSIIQTTDDNDNAPDTIEEIYSLNIDLSGYVVHTEIRNDLSYNIAYNNGKDVYDFHQFTKSEYDVAWNTEDSVVETIIFNDGEAIYFCDNHNYHHLIWEGKDYIFSLSTNISKDALIEGAYSVQIAKE